jgi:hypothetical protein
MKDERLTIEQMTEDTPKKEKRGRKDWVGFVESDAVNFLVLNGIEKMTLDDGEGNKAKLLRRKDGSVLVECASSNVV